MNEVETALADVTAKAAVVAPQREGLRDLSRLDIKPEATTEVVNLLTHFDNRIALMDAFKRAGEALLADGYPNLKGAEVSSEIYAHLKDQAYTIGAALTKFSAREEATELNFSAAEPEAK